MMPFYSEEIHELLDAKFLEHDSYFLFMHVMERIESWYDSDSVKTIKVSSSNLHCKLDSPHTNRRISNALIWT